MQTVNVHEAKTRLSELLAKVAAGKPVVIAKAGKPVARLVPFDAPPPMPKKRLGFLQGEFSVPDDFDAMFKDEIEAMFYGDGQS
jgi:prevent-host-death family protein